MNGGFGERFFECVNFIDMNIGDILVLICKDKGKTNVKEKIKYCILKILYYRHKHRPLILTKDTQ